MAPAHPLARPTTDTLPSPKRATKGGDACVDTNTQEGEQVFEENAGALHRKRRVILRKMVDAAQYERSDPREAVVALVVMVTHMGIALAFAPFLSWPVIALLAYIVGTLFAHMTFLGMHELSHDLMFESLWANRMMLWLVQIPLLIPVGTQFRKFHMLHHARQASQFDPDEPSEFEERWFLSSLPGRIAWASTQFVWYLVRPLLMTNIKVPWDKYDTMCVAHQLCVLAGIFYGCNTYYGAEATPGVLGKAAGYLALSIMFAMGPSVYSAHFLTEHRRSSVEPYPIAPLDLVTVEGTKTQLPEVPTYCYYGIFNIVSYFVGYHCEHHDFPNVPGFRLPQLHRELEFAYANRPHCPNYYGGLLDFIRRPYVNVKQTQHERFTKADDVVKATALPEWGRQAVLTHDVDAMDKPRAAVETSSAVSEDPVATVSGVSSSKASARKRRAGSHA